MRKYGKHNRCPKCGDQGATSLYEPNSLKNGIIVLNERIRRTCKNCEYIWYETPIDIKEK